MKAHPKGKKYQTEKHFNHRSIEFVCIGAFLLVEIAYTGKKNQNTHHDKTTTFAQNVEDSKRIIFARDTIQLNRRSFLNVFCERYSFVARNKGRGGGGKDLKRYCGFRWLRRPHNAKNHLLSVRQERINTTRVRNIPMHGAAGGKRQYIFFKS